MKKFEHDDIEKQYLIGKKSTKKSSPSKATRQPITPGNVTGSKFTTAMKLL